MLKYLTVLGSNVTLSREEHSHVLIGCYTLAFSLFNEVEYL